MNPKDAELLDRFIQSAMENPEGFTKAFEPIWGSALFNPACPQGDSALNSIIRNGINDDWELWLQWREEGYVVVGERDRKLSDQPFGANQAIRILDLISGGKRSAPGLSDEAFWIQKIAEMPYRPKPTRRG